MVFVATAKICCGDSKLQPVASAFLPGYLRCPPQGAFAGIAAGKAEFISFFSADYPMRAYPGAHFSGIVNGGRRVGGAF